MVNSLPLALTNVPVWVFLSLSFFSSAAANGAPANTTRATANNSSEHTRFIERPPLANGPANSDGERARRGRDRTRPLGEEGKRSKGRAGTSRPARLPFRPRLR